MAERRVPVSTYRLQFHRDFGFAEARKLVPFLHDLGISDLYASPIFAARSGSAHGYDVVDPTRLNPELGAEDEFERLCAALQERGMGLLLDIVPNHMAASEENRWWRDVLRNGRASPYASFFDIDWEPARAELRGKVLLPILGEPYRGALESGAFRVERNEEEFCLRYHHRSLPLSPASVERLRAECAETGVSMDEVLRELNGELGVPESFSRLDRLLSEQHYRLAFWRVAGEEINYRRFFDISDLVSLRMEDPDTFEKTHVLVFRLADAGRVTGLRIDHIDGLHDPEGYLTALQSRLTGSEREPHFFILTEKILGEDEELPASWPVAGTTGYDYLNILTRLFVDERGAAELERLYTAFTGTETPFGTVVYQQKKRVMRELFAGEVRTLAERLGFLAAADRHGRDLTRAELERALVEVTACLPVYRTYIRDFTVRDADMAYIKRATTEAVHRSPECTPAVDFLKRVLLLEVGPSLPDEQQRERLRFVMRWQQFTGPIMAKGFEDTALYIYHRLVSLNEVGGKPDSTGLTVSAFHRLNKVRRERRPHGMNAGSTHDSKRSEDVRARINVLSEIPAAWAARVHRWREWNASQKRVLNGRPVPDANTELLIYQTLVGAWPLREADIPAFGERLRAYLEKAEREAKIHTSWLHPDPAYEEAVGAFVSAILEPGGDNRFLSDFLRFQQYIALDGAVNSLAQVLLKVTAPGFPDFYQGSEVWNLTLVDPDNRRPVDFAAHARLLAALRDQEKGGTLPLVREILAGWPDGRVKLYLTYKALHFRREHQSMFAQGEYLPVETAGRAREHVCAFMRRLDAKCSLTVVPRLTARLRHTGDDLPENRFPLGEEVWGDTALVLPEAVPSRWRNVLTGELLSGRKLRLADVLRYFPVGFLTGESGSSSPE